MIINRVCGMCHGNCRICVSVEDGKLVKVQADTSSPEGKACARAVNFPEFLYSPERITYPLIRDGEKGEGKFRRATWDEALDHAAELLRKAIENYGARSVGTYRGQAVRTSPVAQMLENEKNPSFAKRLGSNNNFVSSSICSVAANVITPALTMGVTESHMVSDIANSDYIFAWGKNAMTDVGPLEIMKKINAARQKGAKLIVIDPRQSGLGEIADIWIPIIPGTDGALALAMLKLIIDSERYDKEFVRDYTRGFDDLTNYLDTLSLENLSEICGVSQEQIKELADIFCSTEKISLISFTGLEYQPSAIQNNRAIYILWAITGKLDVEGSIRFSRSHIPDFKLKEIPTDHTPIGIEEFPLFYKFAESAQFSRFPKAVLENEPYPMRGLIVVGGSPAITFPDSDLWREAYKKLDCLIILERYLSEDCRFADVIFPSATIFETYKALSTEDGKVELTEPVIEPVGECRDDVLILSALAKRLGIGEDYPNNNDELRDWLCANYPTSSVNKQPPVYKKYQTGELRADGKPGFPTSSGKLEISSTILEEHGYTPYPKYVDVHSLPGMDNPSYPFVLTTGSRSAIRFGVVGPNLPAIAKLEPYPYMDICAEDAAELNIADGDWTEVQTPFGKAIFKARICGMARHSIHVPHGGGSAYLPEAWKNGNANSLTCIDINDPISGFAIIKTVPCRVVKSDYKE